MNDELAPWAYVTCPYCKAGPGQPCVGVKGKNPGSIHADRTRLWDQRAKATVQVVIEETIHYRREMTVADLEEHVGVSLVDLPNPDAIAEKIREVLASGNADGLAELETDMQESQEVTSTTWHVYEY